VSQTESPEQPSATGSSDTEPRDYTSGVYGSILAATVVVSAGDLRSPVALALLLVVSGLVFWLAHAYAATVSARHGGWSLASVRAALRHEWPVAVACLLPAAAASVCALVPQFTPANGVWVALAVAIVEQQLWGYAAVRNSGLGRRDLIITLGLNLVLGFIIIALKLIVGH
jgi:hypothetical protein